jgi:hypothetical protein
MRHLDIASLAMTMLVGVSLPVLGAQWSVEPTVSLRSGYNDNYRLTTAPHDSVWEADVTPAVKFGVSKEDQGLFGNADVSVRRFYGGSGDDSSSVLDREDYHFKVNSYQQTERNEFDGNVDFTRDSTLDTELTQTGQVVETYATRMSTVLNPSWTRLLNEKTKFNLDYQFNRVDYSNEAGQSNLVNYDFNTVSASLLRQFTPLTQGTISTSFGRYAPETNLNSDSYAIQVGLTRNHSETLSTSWLAGWRSTNSDTAVPAGFCVGAAPGASFPKCTGGFPVQTGTNTDQINNTGAVYAASITKTLERSTLSASVSRMATPSGTGGLLDTTRLSFTGVHHFTETVTGNLAVNYYKQDTIVNSSGGTSQTKPENFFRIQPRITWRWQPQWELAGEYGYAANKNANSDTATQNAVYLTLTYRPTKIFTSR